MTAPRYVAVGEVARPHGIKGELRVRLYNEGSDLLEARPPLRLKKKDGTVIEARVVAARPVNKAVLVTLAGVSDRNAAEALQGAEVLVPRDAFGPLEEGEFYASDIEGAEVVLGGQTIGRVRGLASYPTCDALVVDRGENGTIEVPLVPEFVARVDAENGRVVLVTLEGLEG
jgi:16S rRNA processing protein RimM